MIQFLGAAAREIKTGELELIELALSSVEEETGVQSDGLLKIYRLVRSQNRLVVVETKIY